MAVPRTGILNPEAPLTRIVQQQPATSMPTGSLVGAPGSSGRPPVATQPVGSLVGAPGSSGRPPVITQPPATLFPIPAGKPATSVSAPGGMISQAPAATRPLPTSATRGSQTQAAFDARAAARSATVPAPTAPAPAPAPATTGSAAAQASSAQKPRRKPYVPPTGYDRLAGYQADASPDQIAFEKAQIYARNLARGIEMTDAQVEQRFQDRLARFQATGEPSKNRDPEDAVAAPVAEPVPVVEQPAEPDEKQQQIDDLRSMVEQLQEQLKKRDQEVAAQAQAPAQTGTSQLQTLAQALTPKPAAGSLANLDPARISLMLQTVAPIMFTGSFADVVAALLAAGITPSATELAWLESEVARYRAG